MMHRIPQLVPALCSVLLLASTASLASAEDTHPNCKVWAEAGECEKNPVFMLTGCSTSCDAVVAADLQASEEVNSIPSFFDLSANDISGAPLGFRRFEGQVTVLVNVASQCGYTDSHYKGLVDLWSSVRSTEQINILAFPCDQFGHQEPDSNRKIDILIKRKYGVEFIMMEKIDVNGPNASIVYKYIKSKAGVKSIQWNFATYFVVSPDGTIAAHNGVEPMQLKDMLMGLLKTDEL